MVQHRFNRVWPSSAHPALLPKPQLTLDVTEEAQKIHPWWNLFFSKNAGLEFIPCNFIKNELYHRVYLAWVLPGTFFNILENFLQGITVISFIQEFINLLNGLGLVSQEQTFTTVYQAMFIFEPRCRCYCQCRDDDAEISRQPFISLSGTTYFVELSDGCFTFKDQTFFACMSFFTIFTVVKILAKFGTTRKMLNARLL